MSNLHKLDQLLKSKLELKAVTTDEQVLAALNEDIGKIRKEGQDYIVQDGDIVLIRFNV
jgi:ribosome-binding ATPase YchF (GTP1/OBG family)